MKKILCLLLSFFLLVSCNTSEKLPEYPLSYSGLVEVSCKGVDYTSDVNFNGTVMNISIILPEILKGFCFEVSEEEIKVKSDTYDFDYDKDVVSDFCPVTRLYDVFIAINAQKPEFVEKNGFYVAEFNIENHNCKVIVDKNSMKLAEAEFDEYVFKFKA